MLKRVPASCVRIVSSKKRFFHQSSVKRAIEDYENPFKRTIRILGNDLSNFYKSVIEPEKSREITFGIPTSTDILIIGGGAIGSSIAYWLKEKTNVDSFDVTIIEKDLSFQKCSTCLSVGGLRQQFSLPESVNLSLFGAEFIRTLKRRFGPDADVCFTPHGYLLLASEQGAQQLIDNSKLQNELGAVNVILGPHQLKERFPWMNVNDVAAGCLGLEKEGWFDPWSLLNLIKKGAEEKGAQYINAEVVDFKLIPQPHLAIEGVSDVAPLQPRAVEIQTPNGERKNISFAICVIAAGHESGKLAEYLGIGKKEGILSVPLPIEPRKRFVYMFDCDKTPPSLNTPMTIDYTGTYFRREGLGGKFLCGLSPEPHEEPDTGDLEVDYQFFDEKVWPILAHRVPAFESLKVKNAWSGFYEYNTFDENGVVGYHPYYQNVFIASGFSGHGIQQAPGIGRAVAELILDGRFETIDLSRLCFDRLLLQKPLLEAGII